MQPLISVIIPVYKVEKYLNKCIESFLIQEYKNLEIILVDDGSPDNCPKLCDEWAQKDKRIKVIHKDNGGVASARNAGIKSATGDYLCFCDSDDTVEPEFSKFIVDSINYGADVSVSQIADNKNFSEEKIFNELTSSQLCMLLLQELSISPVVKLIKRTFLMDNNILFGSGLNAEDLEWSTRLFCATKSIFVSPIKYYNYVVTENSASITLKLKNAESFLLNLRKVYDTIDLHIFTKKEKKKLKAHYCDIYFYLIRHYSGFDGEDQVKLLKLLKDNKHLMVFPKKHKLKLVYLFIKLFGLKSAVKFFS